MNPVNIELHILQAIKHVRERKARPDLPRICSQMKKTLKLTTKEDASKVTRQCLDKMLDMGTVIKVQYKKDITYRDAAKWTTTKGRANGKIITPVNLIVKIQAAIDGIIESKTRPAADYDADGRVCDNVHPNSEVGVTVEEIEKWFNRIKEEDDRNSCSLRGSVLLDVLSREIEIDVQTIKKNSDGTFAVGKRVVPQELPNCSVPTTETISRSTMDTECEHNETQQPQIQNMPASAAFEEVITDPKRQRPPSTRKRVSKYDEGVYEVIPMKKKQKMIPKQETSSGDDSPVEPQYQLAAMFRECHEEHQKIPGRHGNLCELLKCCGCKFKAHPDCLNFSAHLVAKIDRETWRCITCKKCAFCNVALRTPLPLTCSGCDLAFHKACHTPVVREKGVPDNWLCMYCTGLAAKKAKQAPTPVNGTHSDVVDTTINSCTSAESNGDVEEKMEEDDDDSQDSIPGPLSGDKSERERSFPSTPRDSPTDDSRRVNNSPAPYRPPTELRWNPSGRINKFDGQEFPDTSDWSAEQIHDYIVSLDESFREGAEALRSQKIDGAALVLLKRDDFLVKFGLNLGPALKLHRLVSNMVTGGCAHMFRSGCYCE